MERKPVGTFAATGTEYAPNPSLADIVQSTTEGHTVYGTFDKYLGGDHAWGGGIDLKYFFHRYFGIGVEGFVLNAHRGAGFDLESNGVDVFVHEKRSENRAVGEVLGTFTLRYPYSVFSFFPLRLGRRRHHLGRWRTRRNYLRWIRRGLRPGPALSYCPPWHDHRSGGPIRGRTGIPSHSAYRMDE